MKKLLVILLIAVQFVATAQEAELNDMVQKLQSSVSTVASASKTFEQQVSSPSPAVIRYAFDEVDSKGVKTAIAYEFNLSDIDPYAVRQETLKDLIFVTLTVKNKQKLIKTFKNNEVQAYDEAVQIHAKDVDNARVLIEILKKGIVPAEKYMASKLKLNSYNEMTDWLTTNVKNVSLGAKSFTQSMSKGEYPGSLRFQVVESEGKTAADEQFTFNLADINVNTIAFKVTGSRFSLKFEAAQKLKSISYKKDGQDKPFVDEITIATNNVDEARDIKTVLSLAIPKAIELVKNDMPRINSDNDALQALVSNLKDVKISSKTLTQSAEPKCLTTISQTEQTANATEKNTYTFNWIDINPNTYRIEVSGDKMFIEVATNEKKKLVMHSKNDKFEGYDSEIKLYADNIETARRLKFALDKSIEKCKASYKESFSSDNVASMVTWLKSVVGEVVVEGASVKQILELVSEGDYNKLKLTKIEVKGNSSVEEVYEFNLADINPMTVNFEIKGKWLFIGMESNFKNKIIKFYKDGKIQPYVYKLDLAVADIETSRNVISALKKGIEKSKSN